MQSNSLRSPVEPTSKSLNSECTTYCTTVVMKHSSKNPSLQAISQLGSQDRKEITYIIGLQ